jgi:hypothetical protein
MVQKMKDAKDEAAIVAAIDSSLSLIHEEEKEIKWKFASSGITSGAAMFGVSVPTCIHAATTNPYVVGGAVLALLSGTLVKYALDQKTVKRAAPVSYLLDVEKFCRKEAYVQHTMTLDLKSDIGPANPRDDQEECASAF